MSNDDGTARAALVAIARCSRHPVELALGPCERCGSFLCAECAVARAPLRCASCLARASDPLSLLGARGLGDWFEGGFRMLSASWPILWPFAIAFAIFWGAVAAVFDRMDGWNVASVALQFALPLYFELVCFAVMLAIGQGRPAHLVEVGLVQARQRFWRALWVDFRWTFAIVALLVFLAVPGLIAMTVWRFAVLATMVGESAPFAFSARITRGRRWEVFALTLLLGLPTILISAGARALLGENHSPAALVVTGAVSASLELVDFAANGFLVAAYLSLVASSAEELTNK